MYIYAKCLTADMVMRAWPQELGVEADIIDHSNPLLKRYNFLTYHGKKRTTRSVEVKEMEGEPNLRTKKQVTEAGAFLECLGAGAIMG